MFVTVVSMSAVCEIILVNRGLRLPLLKYAATLFLRFFALPTYSNLPCISSMRYTPGFRGKCLYKLLVIKFTHAIGVIRSSVCQHRNCLRKNCFKLFVCKSTSLCVVATAMIRIQQVPFVTDTMQIAMGE